MSIPYRTQRVLHRLGIIALVLIVIIVIGWFCSVVWLERYVIYTEEGASIDFSLSAEIPQGEVAVPPDTGETVPIFYNEGENALDLNTELTQLWGYYIDSTDLKDTAAIIEKLNTLESGTPIMLDVKNIYGGFYYSSSVPEATPAGSVDVAAVDKLITELTTRNFYVIARVPAFKDYTYGLNHVPSGLPIVGGGGVLWQDDDGCYWLKPSDNGTLNFLKQIVDELRGMGFDEVVLSHFQFPDTNNIVFNDDRTEALTTAAQYLLTNCGTDSFAISFAATSAGFTLPEGRTRLYLEDVAAQNVAARAAQLTITDPEIRLVFLAETNDTRYNAFGVLRPISMSDVLESQRPQKDEETE